MISTKRKYDYLRIGLASPEKILSWSYGEVKLPETINYRTLKPERDGLFCEIIFGPVKTNQCQCNKPKRPLTGPMICEKCGVELTDARVRRERMGHIKLQAPVVHNWYLKNTPNKIGLLLDMKTREVSSIVYSASYIVVDPGTVDELEKNQIITEQEYGRYRQTYGSRSFKALTGAEAIKKMLQELDLKQLSEELREELNQDKITKQRREKANKRLNIVDAFLHSGNKPEWMVLDVIPVLPPDLRPMVELDGGRFATTDLNDLYRNIIVRNNRLKKEYEIGTPELIIKNEKRLLQEAVDALINNEGRGNKSSKRRGRELKSLSEILKGKQGRFRQNLLGKRVDYSGRSVIVIGPELKMYQCGLPREMALLLFKPFILHNLLEKNKDSNDLTPNKISAKDAKEMIETGHPDAMTELEKIIVDHPVLLNRAPTLHRLSIQAFEPKLIDGKAIRLHPLVTTAFNADFDGDQMSVHVPLSAEAQAEARILMLASKNILAPKDGNPIVTPTQDMVLGNYFLTIEDPKDEREGKIFKDPYELELAHFNKVIGFHTRVALPVTSLNNPRFTEDQKNKYIITTYGKYLFNTIFPKSDDPNKAIPYVCEQSDENLSMRTPDKYLVPKGTDIKKFLKEEYKSPRPFPKKALSKVIAQVFKNFQINETSKTLDKMKDLGFKYATMSGITVSISDIRTIEGKDEIIKAADEEVKQIKFKEDLGFATEEERRQNTIKVWTKAKDDIKKLIEKDVALNSTTNNIYMMSDSGARGSIDNFVQLSGMRGLMAKPNGEQMDIPIKASFIEGLSMSEFFVSTHGSRKGSTDTALKTAESGYLTRQLVDVSQEIVISEDDCKTDKGKYVHPIFDTDDNEALGYKVYQAYLDDPVNNPKPSSSNLQGVKLTLGQRIKGRFASQNVYDPVTGELYVKKNEFITEDIANAINASGLWEVEIRSLLTCNTQNGVCVKCYGSDLSTSKVVERGEAVGVIAAQSIGEPGTQLTMRTFHTGGVAGGDDITQGLPRVNELFGAREPKGKAIISEITGTIKFVDKQADNRTRIVVQNEIETKEYLTDVGKVTKLEVGDRINAGDRLVEGLIDPKELIRVSSVAAVEDYILEEVQRVYQSQGVGIADKHIEIIVRQMLRKVKVTDAGDTSLIVGSLISRAELQEIYQDCILNGKKTPTVTPELLGIIRSALRADSFLSAASFQETTKVLTEAAIRGKKDYLLGLKENVIIGGLMPAGTGLVDGDYYINENQEEAE